MLYNLMLEDNSFYLSSTLVQCKLLLTDPIWGADTQNKGNEYEYEDGPHMRDHVVKTLSAYAGRCVTNAAVIACDDRWLPYWHIALRANGFGNTKTVVCEQRLGRPSKTEWPIKHYYYVIGEREPLEFDYTQLPQEDRRASLGSGEKMTMAGVFRATFTNNDSRRVTGFAGQKDPFPVEAFIRAYTKPGDIVVDPFMGTGTTGIEAVRLGRRFLGFEKNTNTFATAKERIENVHGR